MRKFINKPEIFLIKGNSIMPYYNFTGLIVDIDSGIIYHKNGVFHREDGPAVVFGNYKRYAIDGKTHRLGGPAIYSDKSYREYWINGKKIDKEEHDFYVDLLKLKNLLT